MVQIRRICTFLAVLGSMLPGFDASAAELANRAFQIQYDGSGIRSLKRTNDVHDTEYIGASGALGSVVIRYRSTPNGFWRELRELIGPETQVGAQSVTYRVGTLLPTLAAKSTASAAVGAGGLRALNDGQVPASAGRGGGSGGRGGGPGAPGGAAQVPVFTWSGARGQTQWVQYTFPTEEEVSRAEVFWVADANVTLPQSWRLLYRDSREWREVRSSTPYPPAPNAFTVVEFAPVRTLSMRIEVTLAPNATAGVAEWRVGPAQTPVPPADLKVSQTFKLDGEVLDWTLTFANDGSKPIEIGDLAVPFNFAERTGARGDIYTRKLLRHSLVAGHGSWIYWQRSGGDGPYLVMTPSGRTGFEYFDDSGGAFTP